MNKYYTLLLLCFLFLSSTLSKAQYQINGNASSLGSGCYQLTPNLNTQTGSVWNINQINLNFPFNFTFNVFLGCSDAGADGICFGLQPNSANVGTTGNGMGMGGVTPSLGVFIDTYQNTTDGDPTYDHISINQNGDVSHLTANNLIGPVQASATNINIEDCAYHTLQVSWDPSTFTYTVWFDGVLRLNLVGNDIVNTIFGGNPNVFWGFTGATGGSINLQQFCIILVSNYVNNTICEGVTTQFADSSYSGGLPISNWAWNFGDGTPLFSGGTQAVYQNPSHTYSLPGTYTVQLTISNGGSDSSTISHNVVVVPYPTVSATGGAPICSGQTVNLTGTVTGGTPTYTWAPTTNMTNSTTLNPTVSPSVTTTYTLTATNAPGCTTVDSTTVSVTPQNSPSFQYNSPYCQSATNPLPTFIGAGVAGVFSSTTGLVIDANTGLVNLTSSTPGTYLVTNTIAAVGVCPALTDTSTVTIGAVNNTSFAYSPTTLCQVGTASPVNVITPGGQYSSSAGLVINNSTGVIDLAASTAGNYIVTYLISAICADSTAFNITVAPLPVANAGPDQLIDCHIGTVTLNGTASSSGGNITYTWAAANAGNIVSNGTTNSPVVNATGTYTLTVTNQTTQCTSTSIVNVAGVNPPVAAFTSNPVSGTPPLTVNFIYAGTNATGILWNFGDGNTSTVQNPTNIYLTSGTYTALLIVTNSSGCTDTASETIRVYDNYSLIIPNVFSPNGDNINDLFIVKAEGVASLDAEIYDRWGLKMFSWNDVNSGWDGRATSGQLAKDGTYFYIIKSKGNDGTEHADKGSLMLIR